MIHAKRDSLIALIATLLALAAFAWGLQRLSLYGQNDTAGGAAVAIGGLVAFFGLLMILNFRWALTLTRRMERGQGVFARWTVPADTVTAYVALEAQRAWVQRSRWRPKPGKAAEVLFSNDAVLAGGRYHGLRSKGLQVFTHVHLLPGTPDVIEFLIREITTSSAHNYAAGQFELRIPVPPGARQEAENVIAHFTKVRTDAPADARFWRLRRKIGLGIVLLSALSAAGGYILAEQADWRGEDPTALILLIVGAIFGLMGLVLTLIATVAIRRAS
ncbi:MAG: hypothetical protein EAZ40_00875 [Rhodobacterales bacterium]|nr:MAG: hypothetical protein EAZ40_00875 [Rhodobacterales bacterium]